MDWDESSSKRKDPFQGDHYVCDWEGVWKMVRIYSEDLADAIGEVACLKLAAAGLSIGRTPLPILADWLRENGCEALVDGIKTF